jgi:putative flippase GtrA
MQINFNGLCLSCKKINYLLNMKQLARYAVTGVLSNLSGYFGYLLLTLFTVGPKLAMTIVYILGAFVGFFGNFHWTFGYVGRFLPVLVKYIFVHIIGYTLNFLILFIFVDKMAYPHQIVQAFAIFVVALFLFFILKKIVFNK